MINFENCKIEFDKANKEVVTIDCFLPVHLIKLLQKRSDVGHY